MWDNFGDYFQKYHLRILQEVSSVNFPEGSLGILTEVFPGIVTEIPSEIYPKSKDLLEFLPEIVPKTILAMLPEVFRAILPPIHSTNSPGNLAQDLLQMLLEDPRIILQEVPFEN